MNDYENEEVEIINGEDVGSVDDLINEILKEQGSYCSICNND